MTRKNASSVPKYLDFECRHMEPQQLHSWLILWNYRTMDCHSFAYVIYIVAWDLIRRIKHCAFLWPDSAVVKPKQTAGPLRCVNPPYSSSPMYSWSPRWTTISWNGDHTPHRAAVMIFLFVQPHSAFSQPKNLCFLELPMSLADAHCFRDNMGRSFRFVHPRNF